MSENSGSVAYRENFAALLNDVIQYRERTDNIQSNMEKKITDFGTEMQADDAAVVITPGLLNAVGTGCFQISQRSSAIASMIMSRAQQLFPDEPVTAEIDDPVGFEMQDVPQPRNVSRIISPAAVQTWRQLSDDLIVGKTAGFSAPISQTGTVSAAGGGPKRCMTASQPLAKRSKASETRCKTALLRSGALQIMWSPFYEQI